MNQISPNAFPHTPRLNFLSVINPVGLEVHSELWILLPFLKTGFQTLDWRMRIRKEPVRNLVTHTRIQGQDWAKSSKILTLMSRAPRLSKRPLWGETESDRAVVRRGEGQKCGGRGCPPDPLVDGVVAGDSWEFRPSTTIEPRKTAPQS